MLGPKTWPFWYFWHVFSISGIRLVIAHNFMKSRSRDVWLLVCSSSRPIPSFSPTPRSLCRRQKCIYFISLFQSLREVFSRPEVKKFNDDQEKIEMATAFDTMWAIMLALKEASIELQTTNTPLKYNVEKTVGSDVVTSTIQSKLRNVSFEGLTVIALHLFFYSSVFRSEVFVFYVMMQLFHLRGHMLADVSINDCE